jgi:hypothetical protein
LPRLVELSLLELPQPGFKQRRRLAGFSRGHRSGNYSGRVWT